MIGINDQGNKKDHKWFSILRSTDNPYLSAPLMKPQWGECAYYIIIIHQLKDSSERYYQFAPLSRQAVDCRCPHAQSWWWSQSPSSWSWWRWAMPSGRSHHDLLHPQPSTWPQLLLQVWNITKIIFNQFSFYFLSIALPYVPCSFLVTSVLKRYRTVSDPCIDYLQGSTDNLQKPYILFRQKKFVEKVRKSGHKSFATNARKSTLQNFTPKSA